MCVILGGGAIFAAWPQIYAAICSGFCMAMLAVLAALLLRPVGFKFRSKRESAAWRTGWDWALSVGGFVPALAFGAAVGNSLQGLPLRPTETLRAICEGGMAARFFWLLTPFVLLSGWCRCRCW